MPCQIMLNCIKSIEDPAKVAAIQRFFGVSYNQRVPFEFVLDDECTKEEKVSMVRRISSTNAPEISNSVVNRDNAIVKNNSQNNYKNSVETGMTNKSGIEGKNYSVKYKFWFYFFVSITYLGDVVGYSLVLPFLFWNIDGVIGRKLVFVWTAIMYAGQAVKEIICRARPKCPPVVRLQKRWSEEYGMPSTHAMASVVLPACLIYYGIQRYKFRLGNGLILSFVWCFLISFSRLYLGMHSILDVVVGFLLSFVLLIPLLPLMDFMGESVIEYLWFPLVIIGFSLFLISIYPKPRGPTTAHTRTDTTIILATCAGIEIGCWLNYRLGVAIKSSAELPYSINTPEWSELGLIAARTSLGLICIVISFIFFELVIKITYWVINKTKVSLKDVDNNNRKIPVVDLCFKYLTFCVTSIHVTFTITLLFKVLNIHRSTYFTE